jgi:predicted dehydrogenase
MNVGVIGTGVMGKNHVRVYSKIKDIENVYVYDKQKENVNKLTDSGIIVCDSIDDLLKNVDAASICVPTSLHFEVAKKTIGSGVHCLIEKPITLNVDEGEKLLETIPNDLIVGVGHIERFNPIIDEIFRVADNPHYFEIKRHNPASTRIKDASIVKDLMIHDIDITFNVFFKNLNYDLSAVGDPDVCACLLKFDNKKIVSLSASNISSKKIRSIYIEQDDFTIEGDFMLQDVYVYNKPDKYDMKNDRFIQENIIEKVLVHRVEPLYAELDTFVKSIQKRTKFTISAEQAVNNLRICNEIERALNQ